MTEAELMVVIEKKLYEIADAMMEYYDCCKIRGSSCRAFENNLCCNHTVFGPGLCKFMVDDECHFPNSACRLWICKTAIESTDDKCVEGLKLLEQFALLYGLTTKPLIGHPYSGADKQPG